MPPLTARTTGRTIVVSSGAAFGLAAIVCAPPRDVSATPATSTAAKPTRMRSRGARASRRVAMPDIGPVWLLRQWLYMRCHSVSRAGHASALAVPARHLLKGAAVYEVI